MAEVVGRLLKRLGQDRQVLCVTHLPQVAAQAQQHIRVFKRIEAQSTLTELEPLDHKSRVEEIARMLSGATITEEARAAANRLLQGAG